jgi:hypothetical protein
MMPGISSFILSPILNGQTFPVPDASNIFTVKWAPNSIFFLLILATQSQKHVDQIGDHAISSNNVSSSPLITSPRWKSKQYVPIDI